jgi:hypothetical protein
MVKVNAVDAAPSLSQSASLPTINVTGTGPGVAISAAVIVAEAMVVPVTTALWLLPLKKIVEPSPAPQ